MTVVHIRGARPSRSRAFGDLARAFPLPAFFALAYLLSWSYWLVTLGIMGRGTLAWFVPGAFGPPLAALVVTGVVDGRAGIGAFLHRCVQWRVAPRWYLLALVGLPVLGLIVGLWLGDGTGRFDGTRPAVVVTYLATLSFLVVLGGGQEEPGWRGFALPRMQASMGPVTASVVLGLLWGLWHLPVFVLVPGYNSSGPGVASIATSLLVFTAFGAVGQSLILTWLFNNTRGSVLLAVLAHASLNAGEAFAPGRAGSMAVFVSLAVLGFAITMATRGTLSYLPSDTPAAGQGTHRETLRAPL